MSHTTIAYEDRYSCHGRRYLDSSPIIGKVFAFCAATEKGLERLNKRELEILRLLADGMSPTQVADELGITYKTVANTKWRIKDKLDLRKTADLIRFYLETRSV